MVVLNYFALTHKKRVEPVEFALTTAHYTLELRLVSLFFVLESF